jgi:ureidoacrylate peracid hydrolase
MLKLEDIVDPASTAILVVDMQNDYCAVGGNVSNRGHDVSMITEMIPRLQRFLDGARKLRAKVVFIQCIHEPETDSDVWLARHGGTPLPHCRRGTWGADFCGVAPEKGEPVVIKHRYSAFVGTRLESVLHTLSIKTLVMTGVGTNVCVESTARDGFMRDYNIVFVSDCTATSTQAEHDATLANMRKFFGVVATGDEVLAWYRGARALDLNPVA